MKKLLLIAFLFISTVCQSQTWLQQCLNGTTWGDNMALSCFALNSHHTFTQAEQDTIKKILNSSWVVATFGPTGQNKTVCDFFLFFRNTNTTTKLTTKTNDKSGATLIWWFSWDKTYDRWVQNNLPADTCKNGWVCVFSTDGFGGWTVFNVSANTFTASLPNLVYLKYLTTIYANTNTFTDLSQSLSQNIYLIIVNLSSNSLACPLPDLSNCANLVSLDANSNILTGALFNLNKCTKIEYVNVFINHLSSLPATLEACTKCTTFYCQSNWLTGSSSEFAAGTILDVRMHNNTLTLNGTSNFSPGMTNFYAYNNNWPTAEVNEFLLNFDTYISNPANTPTANIVITLTGTNMGVPTDGTSNTNKLHIESVYAAAGHTATINVNP